MLIKMLWHALLLEKQFYSVRKSVVSVSSYISRREACHQQLGFVDLVLLQGLSYGERRDNFSLLASETSNTEAL